MLDPLGTRETHPPVYMYTRTRFPAKKPIPPVTR